MKIKQKKGISLIALVITIIVMIILAAAIILSLQSSGIIGRANEAKAKSDKQNMLQAAIVAYGEYVLEKNLGETDKTAEEYVEQKLKGQFPEEELNNLNILSDGTIQILPTIPTGFTSSIYEGEQKISDGLVIYKTSSLTDIDQETAMTSFDQFVWVPVPDISDLKRTEWSNNTPINTISDSYTEPFESGYSTEVEEYNKMKASVAKYGGFYIARYEAGDGNITSKRTEPIIEAHTVVSKKGAYVYNYVGWGTSMTDILNNVMDGNVNQGKGAVWLSQNMYPKNSNYTTNLIYGSQWDATLRWLSDKYNVTDSRSWGNYNDSIGDAAINSGYSNMDYTTGKNNSWKAKNIYDMAGNVLEWTMEVELSEFRVARGGYSELSIENYTNASERASADPYYTLADCGFRPVLYLN